MIPSKYELTDEDVRTLVQMRRWMRNTKITGDYVRFSNTAEGMLAHISTGPQRQWIPPKGLFYVTCTMITGASGGPTTQCAYEYKLTDEGGNVLDNSGTSPIAPDMQRPAIGHVTPATVGIARYAQSDGSLHLLWCDEVPTKLECHT